VHKNTAVHWAIHSKNATALSLMVNRNARLDIPNEFGDTGITLLEKLKSYEWIGKKSVLTILDKCGDSSKRGWCETIKNDKVKLIMLFNLRIMIST